MVGGGENWEFSKTLLMPSEPVSDTVRVKDLQRGARVKANKEIGNAVSQGNFLNYTRQFACTATMSVFFLLESAYNKNQPSSAAWLLPNLNLLCALTISSIFLLWKLVAFVLDEQKTKQNLFVLFCSKKKKWREEGRKRKNRKIQRERVTTVARSLPVHRSLLSSRAFLTNSFITARSKTRNEQSPWNKSRIVHAEEKPSNDPCLLTIRKPAATVFLRTFSFPFVPFDLSGLRWRLMTQLVDF